MSKDLAKFDPLKAEVTKFIAPILTMRVGDFKSSDEAIKAGLIVKAYMKQVEETRTDLVSPLNEKVKEINNYARGIKEPLEVVEAHLKRELQNFAIEQEKIKQAELKKLEEEKKRLAEEQEAERQFQLAELAESAKEAEEMFGTKIDNSEQIKRIEERAQIDKAALETTSRQLEYDANQNQIKNVRKNWKVRVVDLNLVPKEFLMIELNEKMALAAARGGNTKISGLEFYQETTVALGQNTYVPRTALAHK